jgi:succinate dehydrogenase/fumarate reductase flavoprotein subunit
MMDEMRWDRVADIVVLGCGAAGMAAAIAGHDCGVEVLVLEKTDEHHAGGNTRLSGGIWFDNRNEERAALYLENLCGPFKLPLEVIRAWATETAKNSDWLQEIGASIGHFENYPPEYPEVEGSDCYGGYMGIDGKLGNELLYHALMDAVRERDIEVIYEAPGKALVEDSASNRVVGVEVVKDGRPCRVGARRGVVLATGGFENNKEMVRDYLGLSDTPIWGSPSAEGDGIRMAMQVGADLWHMSNMMAIDGLDAPEFGAGFATLGLPGEKPFIFVSPDGSRFVDECVEVRHGHVLTQGRYQIFPKEKAFAIFDERARLSGPLVPGPAELPVGWNLLVEKYEWSEDNLKEIEKGWVVSSDTLSGLAEKLGVNPAGLERSVALYNRYCDEGEDEQFNRDPATLIPLKTPPYYGFVSAPILAWSNGGPRRDEDARVLNSSGEVIEGLFAAGNVSSTYSWCKDGGFHIADALAFGRIAGRKAANNTTALA